MPKAKVDPPHGLKGKRQRDRLDRLRKLVAGGTNAPAIDFRRFSLSGMDLKGQRASGFGELGGGFSLSASINFGPLICPGIVTLKAGASIAPDFACRSMILVQRDAASVRERLRASRPDWRNPKPVCLNLLEGFSGHFSVTADVEASVGIGDPLGPDEMGLSIGAKAELGGTVDFMVLKSPSPLYYRSVHDAEFDDDFNDLVNHKIKRAISIFLFYLKKQDVAGEAIDRFAPNSLIDSRIDQLMRAAWKDNPDVGTELDAWTYSWSANIKKFAKWSLDEVRRNLQTNNSYNPKKWKFGISTKDLLAELNDNVIVEFEQWLTKNKPDYIKNVNDHYYAISEQERKRLSDEIERYDSVLAVYENLEIARTMLGRRLARKLTGRDTPKPLKVEQDEQSFDDFLKDDDADVVKPRVRGTVWRYEGSAGAGGKANVQVDEVVGAATAANLVGSLAGSWTSIKFDSASEKGTFGAGQSARRLLTREHTYIRQLASQWKTEAFAKAWAPRRAYGRGAESTNILFGSMNYRSVRLCQYEGETRLRAGSGVTLGASVSVRRLALVTEAMAAGKSFMQMDRDTHKVLGFLVKSLCVDQETLAEFLAGRVYDWMDEDLAVLAEASFEFVGGTVDAGQDERYDPINKVKAAVDRFGQNNPDPPHGGQKGQGNGSTRLQVLRLRLRSTESEEKRRDVFTIGSANAVSDDIAARWFGGGAIFRSYRAGVENTLDFVTQFYGPHADVLNDPANSRLAYEHAVAAPSLFNF